METEIVYCQQRDDDWYQARAGGITASMFGLVMDRMKRGPTKGDFKQAAYDYAFRLAVERIAGECLRGKAFETFDMRRGSELEPEARNLHALTLGVDIERAGFVRTRDGKFGASADGFIGSDGGSEYKCLLAPERLRAVLIERNLDDFWPQVQGGLWLTGRQWWDFCLYCPPLAPIGKDLTTFRINRDDDYIEAMELHLLEFDDLVESYRERLAA